MIYHCDMIDIMIFVVRIRIIQYSDQKDDYLLLLPNCYLLGMMHLHLDSFRIIIFDNLIKLDSFRII
jgi:hypothetical protein